MAPAHNIQLSRFPHNGHHADHEDDDETEKADEESATLLGGRGHTKRDHSHDSGEDDDDVAVLRRAQKAARVGVLREIAAYCLKRPHVVCGVFLAAFFLIPIGWGVLFTSRVHLLECNANVTLQMPLYLVSLLTLEEKIGQMVVADLQDLQDGSPVATRFLGGVINRPGGAPPLGSTPLDWLRSAQNLQAYALQTPHQIPVLFGADISHGHAGVYGGTVFPHQIGLGATHNPKLMERIGVAVAEELRATGVRWGLGPNLSPCRDPRWGGCYQTFSENERLLRMMNTELDGLAGGGGEGTIFSRRAKNDSLVVVSPTGFMGVGGTTNGVTAGVTEGDDPYLRRIFLRSFFDAVSRGVPMLQLGSGTILGERMHNSTWLLGILKGQLGFQGVLLSSYRGVEALGGDWANQVRTGVNIGIDMFLVGRNQYSAFIATLKKEVEGGRVPVERIDDAVKRILAMKVEGGLFREPCGTRGLDLKTVGGEEHRKLARSAVRESLVLLKNGGGGKPKLLPLRRGGVKVLVAGRAAHNMKHQCGGHTAGKGAVGSTILEGVEEVLGWGGAVTYSGDPTKVDGFDYAILVVGEEPYEGAEGDGGSRSSSMLKLNKRSRTMIIHVCGSTPCVLVLVTGRPLFLEPVLPFVDAVVVAWLPGSQGGGVADVLFEGGGHDFVGTLPITWFKTANQLPINYGDKHYDPLFKYGFGLTLNGTVMIRAFHSKE